MPDLARLRAEFDDILKQAWATWVDHLGSDAGKPGISPFSNMDLVPDLEDSPGFNYTVGWLLGVSDAKGWPLDQPEKSLGPKDWTPKKR